MKYFDTLGDGAGSVKQQLKYLSIFFIHEMQDSILLIPKIISNISNNYSSSESFVSLWTESLANKQI